MYNTILKSISFFLLPVLFILAFYIQLNGDFTPGGGFQAGVLLAVPIILLSMVYDYTSVLKIIPINAMKCSVSLGVFIYASVAVLPVFLENRELLNYDFLDCISKNGRHLGILLIEAGIGITVASVMLLIYFSFAVCLSDNSIDT